MNNDLVLFCIVSGCSLIVSTDMLIQGINGIWDMASLMFILFIMLSCTYIFITKEKQKHKLKQEAKRFEN